MFCFRMLPILLCVLGSFDAFAADPNYVPLCGELYTTPVSYHESNETKALREQFLKNQEKFKSVCDTINKTNSSVDLERHYADGFAKYIGKKEDYDVYKKRHEKEISKLPQNLQDEFYEAQKNYMQTYSKYYAAKMYDNDKFDQNHKTLNNALKIVGQAGMVAGGGGGAALQPLVDVYSEKYKNSFIDGRLQEEEKKQLEKSGYFDPNNTLEAKALSNDSCKIAEMKEKYQSSCYSCIVVKTLLEKFMDAATRVYTLCRDAAVQILLIATLMWVAFWVLKNVSSLANVEPASMINTLLIQFFKIMFAYVVIMSGIDTFLIYIVNPIMTAGADFGIGILDAAQKSLSTIPSPKYTYEGSSMLSSDMLNKVVGFTESLDRMVSNNLVIGHALTCHATHAGAWGIEFMGVSLHIPNIWIFICGCLIWFAGFMLTLAVGYYMLDISFKIGIAIMIFPILMALWPFSMTSGKVKTCIKTILRSAAIFAFLAITTSYGMSLISVSLRDITELEEHIKSGDSIWISDTFDITGPYFIIILFAYFYSLKLISVTITEYADQFFKGGLVDGATPMHSELTRATDAAKKATVGAGKMVAGAAAGAGGKVLGAAANATVGKAFKFVKSQFKGKDGNNQPNEGTAVKQAGKATKQTGKATEAAGKGTEKAGQAVEKTGAAASKGGSGLMRAGAQMSGSGFGAILGVPMMIAGAAMKIGGEATRYSGKAVKYAGTAIKKSGKAMKKVGERMEKAGEKMEKAGNRWSNGDSDDKDKNKDNDNQQAE